MSSFKKEMSPIFHFLLCATLTNQIFPSLPFSYCFIYHHCVSGRFAHGCFWSLSGGNLSAQCVQIVQKTDCMTAVVLVAVWFPVSLTITHSLDLSP